MKAQDVGDSFLAKWLTRKAADPLIEKTRTQLQQLAGEQRDLQVPLQWLCELLPDVTGSSAATVSLAAETIRRKWSQGTPALYGETPVVDRQACEARWRRATSLWQKIADQPLPHSKVEITTMLIEIVNNKLVARDYGVDGRLLSVLARFTFYPTLVALNQHCQSLCDNRVWKQGNCPVCGNWPLLAELRGLEQRRYLRCGWCSADWQVPRLYCPYCENRDHNLLSNVHVVDENRVRMTTCSKCSRYVKSITTLGRLSPLDLWITDALTLHLDVAAQAG